MDTPAKIIGLAGGGLVLAGSLYGGITFTHDNLQQITQLTEEVRQVKGNLAITDLKNDIRWLQRRVFRIEEVYGDRLLHAPALIREEYKQNKLELEGLQQELKSTQRAVKALR